MATDNVEIVVARYNEDMKWTLQFPFNLFTYTVYNKGVNENFEKSRVTKIVSLPNVGTEVHTYFHHIVANYNNLSDITVFIPASIERMCKIYKFLNTLRFIIQNKRACFPHDDVVEDVQQHFYDFELTNWSGTNASNLQASSRNELVPCAIKPYGKWYESVFNNKKVQYWSYNSIFSLAKEDIMQHPVEYYAGFECEFTDKNMELGHYVERSWYAVFEPLCHTALIHQYGK